MGSVKRSKKELVAQLGELGRTLSTRTVLFHEAAAARMGLGVTDHKCLDFIQRATEPLTAGKLAELTGLTTGAITGVLDRLERAGFVRREKDPNDRRQTYVRLVPASLEAFREIFGPFSTAWEELATKYTAEELELIERHLTESVALLERETARVRGVSAEPVHAEDLSADGSELGGVKRGFLEILRGASHYEITTAPGRFLYRAQFEGTAPKVTTKNGHVAIKAAAGFFDWRRTGGRITLTDVVPWRFVFHGGLSRTAARVADVVVQELTVHGGMSEVDFELGDPEGVVPVRLHGGLDKVRFSYPKGTALRIAIHGGVHKLALDTLELGSADGVIRWESPGFGKAERGYDVQVHGGTNEFAMKTR